MRSVLISACAAISIAASGIATAETTPENAIKYRKAVMSAMAGHTSALALQAFGQVDEKTHMADHAAAMAALGKEIAVVFPANSATGDTEALPAIWAEPDRFAAAVDAVGQSTAELQAAVDSGNRGAIAKAFKAVGDSCKGCHDNFREE